MESLCALQVLGISNTNLGGDRMKILVIGGGGREHALAFKINQSPKVDKIYCAPGNGGTLELAENIDIDVDEIEKLLNFAKEKKIDLTVVGPELPLVRGIVDRFQSEGLNIFGVDKISARLEGSKDFSKKFMERHRIATARYIDFDDLEEAERGISNFSYPLVIKADGLCAGKGVVICQDEEMAKKTLKEILQDRCFGSEGSKIVVEEFLDGEETSLLCFVSGGRIIPMESAKDFKKIYEGDKGLNTGGVGCHSPSSLMDKELMDKIKKNILVKIEEGFKIDKMDFRGILFIGLMIVDGEPKVLEFNVRFGDPETEVLMPRLDSDIVDIFQKTIDGNLREEDLRWKKEECITVVATSKGYPEIYEKGFLIEGIDKLDKDIILFHNGTKKTDNELFTNGGRVLSFTALGENLDQAREKLYSNIDRVSFKGMKYRKDI